MMDEVYWAEMGLVPPGLCTISSVSWPSAEELYNSIHNAADPTCLRPFTRK